MKNILLIFLGGGIGSGLRYWTSLIIRERVADSWQFAGTLTCNVLGCGLIGLIVAGLASHPWENHPATRFLLLTGVLGGFTTYSTFSLESILMAQQGQWRTAFAYAVSTLALCLFATSIGFWLGTHLRKIC